MEYDICLVRGEPLSLKIDILNEDEESFNLSNYKSKMQIRENFLSKECIDVYTKIENSSVFIEITKDESLALPIILNDYYGTTKLYYDLIIFSDTDFRKILGGAFKIEPTITKVEKDE